MYISGYWFVIGSCISSLIWWHYKNFKDKIFNAKQNPWNPGTWNPQPFLTIIQYLNYSKSITTVMNTQ